MLVESWGVAGAAGHCDSRVVVIERVTGWRRTIADAAFDRVVSRRIGRLGACDELECQMDGRVVERGGVEHRLPKRANDRSGKKKNKERVGEGMDADVVRRCFGTWYGVSMLAMAMDSQGC